MQPNSPSIQPHIARSPRNTIAIPEPVLLQTQQSLTAMLVAALSCLILLLGRPPACQSTLSDQPALTRIGKADAAMLVDPQGKPILSQNQDTLLIPASTLKIFTALMALHYLGDDYRFSTDFFLDDNHNLKVRGYGDPLLISEVLQDIAATLSQQVNQIDDIVLDDAYFDKPLTIPGVSDSYEPYDAPNGALVANFNTVNFTYRSGRYISAEPQTPLLPMVLGRIQRSGLKQGRIVLSHHNRECTRYFGHLLRHFLEQSGVVCRGQVRTDTVNFKADRLIYRYTSRFDLQQIIAKLLEYSNNYMTNQLMITVGAQHHGPPGTLAKGVQSARQFARSELNLRRLAISEGSGISRQNRVTAREMVQILIRFKPYSRLLRKQGNEYFKTGTLNGISTRAGYLSDAQGRLYPYVILVNTPGRSADRILEVIRTKVP